MSAATQSGTLCPPPATVLCQPMAGSSARSGGDRDRSASPQARGSPHRRSSRVTRRSPPDSPRRQMASRRESSSRGQAARKFPEKEEQRTDRRRRPPRTRVPGDPACVAHSSEPPRPSFAVIGRYLPLPAAKRACVVRRRGSGATRACARRGVNPGDPYGCRCRSAGALRRSDSGLMWIPTSARTRAMNGRLSAR